jgi:hypothetical protein
MFFIKPISKKEVTCGDYFIIETTKYGNRYYQTDSSWKVQEHYVNQWIPSFKTIDLTNENYSVYLILPNRILAENMKWLIRRPNMQVIVCE